MSFNRSRAAYNHRLRHRVALESQLLAEERWIITNLKKIKKIRNCLQIERLQLESYKAKLLHDSDKSKKPTTTPMVPEATPMTSAERSGVQPRSSRNSILFEVPLVSQETLCNDEELDLAVSSSVLSQPQNNSSMEEYDEDDDGDYDSYEIDMNMFMNGAPKLEEKPGKDRNI